MNCNFCQSLLTYSENLYHHLLCPAQQFYKQLAELDFLHSNAKISTRQCRLIRDALKKNYYKLYREEVMESCQVFREIIIPQQEDIVDYVSDYAYDEINLTPNYHFLDRSQYKDTPQQQDFNQEIEQQPQSENLVLQDEIEIDIPDIEILKKKVKRPKYNCIVCDEAFFNKKSTLSHMSKIHFLRPRSKKKNRQK